MRQCKCESRRARPVREWSSRAWNPQQLAAEATLRHLLTDPEVRKIRTSLRAELLATSTGQTADGKARVDEAIGQWTNSLILREAAARDLSRPAFIWETDDTPHRWSGYTIGRMAIAGDNPDHIYRAAFVDGAGRYEITGHVDPSHRPAQFSFESTRDLAGSFQLHNQSPGHADMGNQIGMITDRAVTVSPEGNFHIVLGEGVHDGEVLATAPGPVAINVRDVLSAWGQRPNRLSIRRLDASTTMPLTDQQVRQKVIEDLPGYIRFWSGFSSHWFGGLKIPNKVVGPVARDGNWGFLAAARYHLGPEEALVVTTTRGAAQYTGIQVTDPWMVAADATKHQTSINISQAVPNPDGSFTYVVSPTDPRTANWLDTTGWHDGYLILRWQGYGSAATSAGLLRDVHLVGLSQLEHETSRARYTPVSREEQIRKHASGYVKRLGD